MQNISYDKLQLIVWKYIAVSMCITSTKTIRTNDTKFFMVLHYSCNFSVADKYLINEIYYLV